MISKEQVLPTAVAAIVTSLIGICLTLLTSNVVDKAEKDFAWVNYSTVLLEEFNWEVLDPKQSGQKIADIKRDFYSYTVHNLGVTTAVGTYVELVIHKKHQKNVEFRKSSGTEITAMDVVPGDPTLTYQIHLSKVDKSSKAHLEPGGYFGYTIIVKDGLSFSDVVKSMILLPDRRKPSEAFEGHNLEIVSVYKSLIGTLTGVALAVLALCCLCISKIFRQKSIIKNLETEIDSLKAQNCESFPADVDTAGVKVLQTLQDELQRISKDPEFFKDDSKKSD